MTLPTFFRCIALVLAANYFAFQVELFDCEYEANHPKQAERATVTSPSLTWESFDKDNAPQPFVFDALIRIEPFFFLPPPVELQVPDVRIPAVLRDKSPPVLLPASI